jgi:hypothetical protein
LREPRHGTVFFERLDREIPDKEIPDRKTPDRERRERGLERVMA